MKTAAVTTAGATMRGRRQEQLDEVIDTAARLFAANGFGHTGMAELCDTLNMGRGQLYNLIVSKENLLRLIHERFTVLLFEGAARINARGLPPMERLRQILRHLMETIAEHQDYVWVFFNEWRVLGADNLVEYRRRRRVYQDMVERILREGIDDGTFTVQDTHITVLGILGMANYSYQWLQADGRLSPATIADMFCDMILDGIRSGDDHR
jgi:AcrR family transcriptional regulator